MFDKKKTKKGKKNLPTEPIENPLNKYHNLTNEEIEKILRLDFN